MKRNRFSTMRHTYAPLAAMAVMLAACATSEEPEEKKPEPRARMEIVGRVASIPPGGRFVLIQSYGDWKVADGTILTTRSSEERSASLRVSGEKLGQFAAADVQAGEVAVGDVVVLLSDTPPAPASAPQEIAPVDTGENPEG